MTTLLWIVGYLAVGFGVVWVWAVRPAEEPDFTDKLPPTMVAWLLWPLALIDILRTAIRWCARRLP